MLFRENESLVDSLRKLFIIYILFPKPYVIMANTTTTTTNPWYGLSMLLIGLIVGSVATSTVPAFLTGSDKPVAVAPTPSAAPTPSPAPAPTANAEDLPEIDFDRDHIRGPEDATVFLVEYSDIECPFCARHHATAQELVDSNDDVAWVYRHFPLQFHPNATPLAEASECVWEQGGNEPFWDFIDLVFEQGADAAKIAEYADTVGVDGSAVQDCVDAGTYADYVADQMAGGSAAGVTGTPGNVLINIDSGEARLVSGAQPVSAFQAAVDDLR